MFVKSGALVTCVIECEQPVRSRSLSTAFRVSPLRLTCVTTSCPTWQVCIEAFEQCPQLGRFTLRDEGKTIGIGKCLALLTDTEETQAA